MLLACCTCRELSALKPKPYLSKQGFILSKLRDRLEAQGVELAELPRDPGPGPLENVSPGPLHRVNNHYERIFRLK